MKLEISQLESGIKQAKLVGRLDMRGTGEIDNQFTFLISTGKDPVLVDMSEVPFLSSIGMRMLLSNAKTLAKRGSKMVLLNPTPLVKDALVTTGFDQLIPMYDDFDEACTVLQNFVRQ